jgi:hypothetical protein
MYKDINSEEKVETKKNKIEKNSSDVYCDALSWTDTSVDGCPSS